MLRHARLGDVRSTFRRAESPTNVAQYRLGTVVLLAFNPADEGEIETGKNPTEGIRVIS